MKKSKDKSLDFYLVTESNINLTIAQTKNIIINHNIVWVIIVFHFFTFSSSSQAVNILNAHQKTKIVIRK